MASFVKNNFVKYCLSHGATVRPMGEAVYERPIVALCNPSVCVVGEKIISNLRGVNYQLWHSDRGTYNDVYGPTCYITEQHDMHLRTENYVGELYQMHTKINNPSPARWEFVGLEDIRLVYWEGKLYGTGVRRDYWYKGEGRMVLAEIDLEGNYRNEIILEIEGANFCEKNWMPISDLPYHYVRWVNPTQVVRVDPLTGSCEIVREIPLPSPVYSDYEGRQMRGSSQVVRIEDKYIAVIHTVHLEYNEKKEKCATDYAEQIIVWDKDFNLVHLSEPFYYADFTIEFTTGLAYKDGIFYFPFALQDNAPFCLEVDARVLDMYLRCDGRGELGMYEPKDEVERFFHNTRDSQECISMGHRYLERGDYASACVFFGRAADYRTFDNDALYDAEYWLGRCLAWTHECDEHEEAVYLRMIDLKPEYSDAYYMMGVYHHWRANYRLAYTMSKLAYDKNCWRNIDWRDNKILLAKCLYYTEDYLLTANILRGMREECTDRQKADIDAMLAHIEGNKQNIQRIL